MKRTVLFGLCATLGSPALATVEPFANPISDPAGWVTDADFPQDAGPDDKGHMRYSVIVGRDCRVRDCWAMDYFLLDDEGSSRFSRMTCDLLRARARFVMPKDAQGRTLLGNHVGHIYWYRNQMAAFGERLGESNILLVRHALPKLPPSLQERFASLPEPVEPIGLADVLAAIPPSAVRARQGGMSAVRVSITAEGEVAGCKLIATSGDERLDRAACKLLAHRKFRPAIDKSGKAVAFRTNQPIYWQLDQWLRIPVTLSSSDGPEVELSFEQGFLGGVACRATMAGKRITAPLSDDICDAFRKSRRHEMVPGHTVTVQLAKR